MPRREIEEFRRVIAFEVRHLPKPKPPPLFSKWGTRHDPRADPWLWAVRLAAKAAIPEGVTRPVFPAGVPLVLCATFYLPRPRSHSGTGRNEDRLRPGAPEWPTAKPDLKNLVAGVEDCLADWPKGAKALLYRGDQQIVEHITSKHFVEPGHGQPSAVIRIYPA